MARSKLEIKAQKELEADGWKVDWKIRPSGFKQPRGYNVDYFGVFDLMAHKPFIIRFIAIKGTMGIPAGLRKSVENFKSPQGCIKELWYYRKLASDKRKFVAKKEVIE